MNIGVIDSGVGGFSILAVLEKNFPHQKFLYISDNKNFPYSEKNTQQLQTIGEELVTTLQAKDCSVIVIACNTLTVNAIQHLREKFPSISFVGTVPAVKTAAQSLPKNSHIVVLATKNTVESYYLKVLIEPWQTLHHWSLVGSTSLVEKIENWDKTAISVELQKLLKPVAEQAPITGIVLGCTHFPFVETVITSALADGSSSATSQLQFFEPSIGITKRLEQVIKEKNSDGLSLENNAITPTENQTTFLSTASTVSPSSLEEKYNFLKKYL
jgi:glutamate racemase